MSNTRDKLEQDLNRLIENGDVLLVALQRECLKDEIDSQLVSSLGEKKATAFIDSLPSFDMDYQAWYSEATALVKQTLPDRLKDFVSYYEYQKARKSVTFQNYMIKDKLQGLAILDHKGIIVVSSKAAIPEFVQQLSIVKAAKSSLSSTLTNMTTLLQADLFDSELDSAEALSKAGYLRAAGAICGVLIEKHLKQVCINRNLSLGRTKSTISNLIRVLKDNEVISMPMWRFIQLLADIRNICDHDKGREPTQQELADLLAGTNKALKTVF